MEAIIKKDIHSTTLDLHGVRSRDVESMVENFVLAHQESMPLEIIYGNSTNMYHLVTNCLKRLGVSYNSGYKNQYGRLLVMGQKD